MLRAIVAVHLIAHSQVAASSQDHGKCASDQAQMLQSHGQCASVEAQMPQSRLDVVVESEESDGEMMFQLGLRRTDVSQEVVEVIEHVLEAQKVREESNTMGSLPITEEAFLQHTDCLVALRSANTGSGNLTVENVISMCNVTIKKAIAFIEETMSPEEAAENDMSITSDVMEVVDNENHSPEEDNANDPDAFQGDIETQDPAEMLLLQGSASHDQRWAGTLWTDKSNIPYCFSPSLSDKAKQAFLDAVQHYEEMIPCLDFQETSEIDGSEKCAQAGIYVKNDKPGCFAHIGMPHMNGAVQLGQSVCNLGPGCETMGIAAHEIGHNLGMLHEQARADRVAYVQVLWENIRSGRENQYAMNNQAAEGEPYDIMSLMHYGDDAFAKVPHTKTMEPLTETKKKMGNRMGLTHADAMQVGTMYNCSNEIDDFRLCTNDPAGCTQEDCTCHQSPNEVLGIIKVEDEATGCKRCLPRCPDYPDGSPSMCTCLADYTKVMFNLGSGGKDYHSCCLGGNCCEYSLDGECDEANGWCLPGSDKSDCTSR